MPLSRYLFASGTLGRLFENQVAWQAVLFVLHVQHPVHREHIGVSVLRVTGADERGHLLMVVLEETLDDDVYLILSARYLEAEESAVASMNLTPKEEQ